jgi:Zn-dependent peptidase ImmA (M78 family)/transcriptional regulator with XRE-family HTH domain
MMSTPPINPEVLLLARHSRGRTQQEVAVAAGVTQGLISKAEDGLTGIGETELETIANFLGYPVRLFYTPGRVRELGSACLYHRKRKTLPAKILKQLDARMFVRNLNVCRLLDDIEVQGHRMFHTMDTDEYGGSPIEVARALRAAWRVPDGPIKNLTALIESAGGVVILENFGTHKLFGMSCWTTRGHPLFFLNSETSTAELRWTLAHELGHLTMHAAAPTGDPEGQADAFAGEFLAPEALFRHDARRLDFDRLPNLKMHWRLTMKGVINRAQKIGAIDVATSTRLYKQYSARGYNAHEPYPLPPEPPTLVDEAIRVHLQEHGYTREELAESLLLTAHEFSHHLLGEQEPSHGNVLNLFPRAPRHSTV